MHNSVLSQLKNLEGHYFTHTRSQAGKWLNYKLKKVTAGEVEVELQVREEMTNPNGMLHGGMIGMICDEMCGLAFYTLGKATFYTTVNLSIDFLYGAPVHSRLICVAKVLRSGKKIANTECIIYNDDGDIIAKASSNLLNTDKPVFDLHLSN